MKINKIFAILILSVFLLIAIPLASASIDYSEENKTYEINSFFPTWLGGNGISTVKLINNTDNCLIDCSFTLEFNNEEEVNLLENIKFIDRRERDVSTNIKNINFYIGKNTEIKKTKPIYEQICEERENNFTNSTIQTEYFCYNKQIGEKDYYENELIWKKYNGEKVNGLNYLRGNAKKESHKSVDWIITFRGKELTNWAWWNSSWTYYKEYTNLTGNITYMEINKTVNDNADWNDTRFISCYNDSLVFNHTLEAEIGIYGQFRVNNLAENCTLRYYGNSEATSTSSASDVYFNPISAYYLDANANDFVGNNHGTVTGATLTSGYINGSYDFDGNDENINFNLQPLSLTSNFSISSWVNLNDTISIQNIASQGNTGTTTPLIQIRTNGDKLDFFVRDNGGDSATITGLTTLLTNKWYYVVLIWDSSIGKGEIFLNSLSEGSDTNGAVGIATFNKFSIGNLEYTISDNWFNGKIDEVLIYDKALTPTQINQLYTQTAPNIIEGNETRSKYLSFSNVIPLNASNSNEEFNYFNATIIPIDLEIVNTSIYIFDLNDTFYNQTKIYLTNESISESYLVQLENGNYTWYMEACSDDLNETCVQIDNRTLFVDFNPPIINIASPTGIFSFLEENYTLNLNYSITDNESGLDDCWYSYNETNYTLNCSENHTTFNYIQDQNFLIVYANDTYGGISNKTINWSYEIFEISTEFESEVLEASTNSYQYHFKTPYSIVSAQFNYINTSYTANIFSNETNQYRLESIILVPSVENDTNYTLNFGIITDNNGLINSTEHNQTVQVLSVDNCSTFNNTILVTQMFDERTLEDINGSIEANFELLNPSDYSTVAIFTTLYNNVHEARACTNLNISDRNFFYNLELRYYQDGAGSTFNYVPEFYNIQKANTDTLPQNISLYDLNSNESTEFTIFYRDNNYVTKANVLLQVLRRYVSEGIFRVVEIPITSSEGSAVAHFDLNNYLYKIIVTEGGEILNIFDNPTIRCESEISGICTINLKGEKPVSQAEGVYQLNDFSYAPTQSNESITITFSSPSGTNKNVRVQMIQTSPFTDPIYLCNTSILSSAGSVFCNVNKTIGDSLVDIKIYVDEKVQSNLKATVEEDLNDSFMLDNYFIGALLLILLIGMGVSSPQIMPWIGVFGLVLLGFIFLLKSSSIGLMLGAITWFVVAAIIITFKISGRTES